MEEITIESTTTSVGSLYKHLEPVVQDSVELIVRREGGPKRGADSSVLIAVVGAAGTSLGALITGMLSIMTKIRTARIVIQGKDGSRIEVPADFPADRLDQLMQRLESVQVSRIVLDR